MRLFSSSTRLIGDASLQIPIGAKMRFQSPADGQAFRVGAGDWFANCRMYHSFVDLTGATPTADTDIWIWSFGRDVNNHVTLRYLPGSKSLTLLWKLANVNLVNLVHTWTLPSNIAGSSHFFMRKTGNTIKCGLAALDPDNGPVLSSSSATYGSGTLNLDSVMSTTGRATINARYPGVTPDAMAISDLLFAELAGGSTWADVELDTDQQILNYMIDPDRLTPFAADFDTLRSFDLCSSDNSRKLLTHRQAITTSDKLICLHSGLVLSASQDASPTASAIGCPPYAPASSIQSMRPSPTCRPMAVAISESVFVASFPGGGFSDNQDCWIGVFDSTTGLITKPAIPFFQSHFYLDASNGNAVTPYYGWGGQGNVGDNHTQYDVAYDSINDRLIVASAYHANVVSNVPASGDALYFCGAVQVIRDSGVTVQHLPYPGHATAIVNTANYGAILVDNGVGYLSVRGGDTGTGVWRIIRIAADDTLTSVDVTRSASSDPVEAIIPDGLVAVGGRIIATASPRIATGEDFVSVAAFSFDPAEFTSTTTGWNAADGTNIATMKGTLGIGNPILYPLDSPGRDALIAFRDFATPIDSSEWDYGESVQATFSSGPFAGMITRRGTDADRSDATLHFESWLLHVFILDGDAVRRVRSFDLSAYMAIAAPGNEVSTGNPEYQVNRIVAAQVGNRLEIAVMQRQGEDLTGDVVGTSFINLGKSLGVISIKDWTAQQIIVSTSAVAQADAETVGGLSQMVMAVQGSFNIFQAAVASGAPVKLTNAPESTARVLPLVVPSLATLSGPIPGVNRMSNIQVGSIVRGVAYAEIGGVRVEADTAPVAGDLVIRVNNAVVATGTKVVGSWDSGYAFSWDPPSALTVGDFVTAELPIEYNEGTVTWVGSWNVIESNAAAIVVIDDIVDAIVADTNELQTNQGNWLTATEFSTLDAAGVRSAVGMASADLDDQLTVIENSIATVYGLDVQILEDTGTTLPDAIAAEAIKTAAIKVKTDQFVFTVADQVDANALTGGSGGCYGPGDTAYPVTIREIDGTPIPNAKIWVTTDAEGLTTVAGAVVTDVNGSIPSPFMLNSGTTYYLWGSSTLYNFSNPQEFTVPQD